MQYNYKCIATKIKLKHSWRNYTHLRFSQRYEDSSSNETPCSMVGMSRRSEWLYRLRQNPKRRNISTTLVRPSIPEERNLRTDSNHTIGYTCCYSIWNHSSSTKMSIAKIYKSIILPVLPGCGTLFLTLTLERTHAAGVTIWQTGCWKLHTYLHRGQSIRTRLIKIGVSACRNNLVDLSVTESILKWP